jgi:hypothetical protein
VISFMAISMLGVLASYALASTTHGFADDMLDAWDKRLGFDWVALYRLVAGSRALQLLGQGAYATIYVTPAILFFSMAWQGQSEKARRFLLSYWAAVVLTLLIFPMMPARGALNSCGTVPCPICPPAASGRG